MNKVLQSFNIMLKKKSRIIASILFIVVFFFCDNLIGSVLMNHHYLDAPNMHSLMWKDFYKQNKNTVDVIFIGSSHARFAFDTRIFDKELEIKTFNLSSSDQTPVVGYYALKEALKYQQPRLIVYEAYWRKFGSDDNTTPAYFVYDYVKGIDVRLQLLANLITDKKYEDFLADAFSKSYKYRDNFIPALKHIISDRAFRIYSDSSNRIISYGEFSYFGNGFFGNDLIASKDVLYNSNPFKYDSYFKWNNEQLDYFERTLEFCKEKNIRVLVITAPLPKATLDYVKDYDSYSKKMKSIIDKHGLEYIDYNLENIEKNSFKNDMFFDSNHLNNIGTVFLDKKLIPEIQKCLNY